MRRLEWATGFSGSVGIAIVLQDRAALFVDGRYVLQAREQTDVESIEVHDVSKTSRVKWLSTNMEQSQCLALDTRLQSPPDVEQTLAFAGTRGRVCPGAGIVCRADGLLPDVLFSGMREFSL